MFHRQTKHIQVGQGCNSSSQRWLASRCRSVGALTLGIAAGSSAHVSASVRHKLREVRWGGRRLLTGARSVALRDSTRSKERAGRCSLLAPDQPGAGHPECVRQEACIYAEEWLSQALTTMRACYSLSGSMSGCRPVVSRSLNPQMVSWFPSRAGCWLLMPQSQFDMAQCAKMAMTPATPASATACTQACRLHNTMWKVLHFRPCCSVFYSRNRMEVPGTAPEIH